MKYNPFEKEIIRRLLTNIGYEYKSRGKVSSETFAWLVWQKIDRALEQIIKNKKRKYLQSLRDVVPEKRGNEECDCSKGTHACGCRVNDYNQAVDEIKFAVDLVRKQIEED